MKTNILVTFFLITVVTAFSEVPSLINYQGRLTNAEGEPLTGTKNFELKIFDSKTEGKLLYTENVGDIQLAEGGVYSFQFGGTGTSNTQTTELVGGGDGSVLYQKVLSNTPVVEGSVSVSDGTYTWSEESGSSNEDDFSSSFSKNLSRITVNYFADAPNDSRQIKVTYRYQSEGIMGAFGSGSEHWLQLSIDGEVQSTRERVLAVPFALYAGKLAEEKKVKVRRYLQIFRGQHFTQLRQEGISSGNSGSNDTTVAIFPEGALKINKIKTRFRNESKEKYKIELRIAELEGENIWSKSYELNGDGSYNPIIDLPVSLDLDPQKIYFLTFLNYYHVNNGGGFWRSYTPNLLSLEIHYTE